MGLIIKDKIQSLMVGYPTVSDKYDVEGGLANETLRFGDLVVAESTGANKGYYKKVDANTVDGIVLATNVKLNTTYPADAEGPVTVKGEAFNVLIKGRVAVALDSGATASAIVKGADAKLSTAHTLSTTGTAIAGNVSIKFTGFYEMQGTTIVAEVEVK